MFRKELNIESKVHDITILDYVVLALNAHFACFADSGLRTILDIVVVLDDLSADEATLEVGVDDAGGLRRFHTFLESPCAAFLGAGGEEGLEAEESVGGFDEAIDAALLEAEVFEEHLLLLIGLELGDVGLTKY